MASLGVRLTDLNRALNQARAVQDPSWRRRRLVELLPPLRRVARASQVGEETRINLLGKAVRLVQPLAMRPTSVDVGLLLVHAALRLPADPWPDGVRLLDLYAVAAPDVPGVLTLTNDLKEAAQILGVAVADAIPLPSLQVVEVVGVGMVLLCPVCPGLGWEVGRPDIVDAVIDHAARHP